MNCFEEQKFSPAIRWREASIIVSDLTADQELLRGLAGQKGWLCFSLLKMKWLRDGFDMPVVAVTDAGEKLEETLASVLLGLHKKNSACPEVMCDKVADIWQKNIADLVEEEWEKQHQHEKRHWEQKLRDLDARFQELTTTEEHRLAALAADCRTQRRRLYSLAVGEREEAHDRVEAARTSLRQEREGLIASQLDLAEERAVLASGGENFLRRDYAVECLTIARWSVQP